MGRLIDADKLKSHFSWWADDDKYKRVFTEIIDVQETVDVPKVIRCQDCRYYGTKYQRCGLFATDKLPEGYCDEALRRPVDA